MAASTSYQDPPAEQKPTLDFFAKMESLRAGRYPAVIGWFTQDREVLLEDGVTVDTNAFGLPLFERAPLGKSYGILVDSATLPGLQRLAALLDSAANRTVTYIASGVFPTAGLALEAALADEWYDLRALCLAAVTVEDLAALGVTPQGDHPFVR